MKSGLNRGRETGRGTGSSSRSLSPVGIAALVNIGSRIVFNLVMPYEIAILVAYVCGMTDGYISQQEIRLRRLRPRRRQRIYRDSHWSILLAVAQVWIVSVGLARLIFPAIGFIWHDETVAHVIGVLVPVFTSYLGHKHFSFAPQAE